MKSSYWALAANARYELLPEAGARDERTLEAVSSMPLLGDVFRFLLDVRGCFLHCLTYQIQLIDHVL
jgi:hypothetical protein